MIGKAWVMYKNMDKGKKSIKKSSSQVEIHYLLHECLNV